MNAPITIVSAESSGLTASRVVTRLKKEQWGAR